jgi:hypothetical protein
LDHLVSRVVTATAAGTLALILVSVAILFLGGALYLWLVSLAMTPSLAALLVGVAGLVLALLIVITLKIMSRRRPPAQPGYNASELGALVAQRAVSLVKAHPYRAFAVSLVAGFTAGVSPEIRKIFEDIIKK